MDGAPKVASITPLSNAVPIATDSMAAPPADADARYVTWTRKAGLPASWAGSLDTTTKSLTAFGPAEARNVVFGEIVRGRVRSDLLVGILERLFEGVIATVMRFNPTPSCDASSEWRDESYSQVSGSWSEKSPFRNPPVWMLGRIPSRKREAGQQERESRDASDHWRESCFR